MEEKKGEVIRLMLEKKPERRQRLDNERKAWRMECAKRVKRRNVIRSFLEHHLRPCSFTLRPFLLSSLKLFTTSFWVNAWDDVHQIESVTARYRR